MDSNSLKDIAVTIGFKTPSTGNKHIEKSPVCMRIMFPMSTAVFRQTHKSTVKRWNNCKSAASKRAKENGSKLL